MVLTQQGKTDRSRTTNISQCKFTSLNLSESVNVKERQAKLRKHLNFSSIEHLTKLDSFINLKGAASFMSDTQNDTKIKESRF